MSIQNVFRTFRSSISPVRRTAVPLDAEVALYRRRAEMALEEERFQDALVFLAKILRLNPYDLSARMLVAQTYHYGLHEVEKALMTYEKVVATSGYDDSNPYCAAARSAVRELDSAIGADGTVGTLGTVGTFDADDAIDTLAAGAGGAATSRVDLAGIVRDERGELPQTVAL